MRKFKIVFILLIIILFTNSCKKEYEYRVNIINRTNCKINKLIVQGKTDYVFTIDKDGETGEFIFDWKGSRTNWFAGEIYFNYNVESFIDTDSTFVNNGICMSGITLKDLSLNSLNVLELTKENVGLSSCKHCFHIDHE